MTPGYDEDVEYSYHEVSFVPDWNVGCVVEVMGMGCTGCPLRIWLIMDVCEGRINCIGDSLTVGRTTSGDDNHLNGVGQWVPGWLSMSERDMMSS